MELEILHCDGESTWLLESAKPFDPKHTLVIVFGASNYLDSPESYCQIWCLSC